MLEDSNTVNDAAADLVTGKFLPLSSLQDAEHVR